MKTKDKEGQKDIVRPSNCKTAANIHSRKVSKDEYGNFYTPDDHLKKIILWP